MNVIWRTVLVIVRARVQLRLRGRLTDSAVGRLGLRTLPTDIDLLGHMNNGRYLSLFDLGRWNLLVRVGVMDSMRKRGWYAVVANETITFRKSLKLWQRFTIETRMLGFDEHAVLMEHRAVVKGEVYARAIVRARILKREGGVITHDELFEAMPYPEGLPEMPAWVTEWAAASALPSRRRSANSVWPWPEGR